MATADFAEIVKNYRGSIAALYRGPAAAPERGAAAQLAADAGDRARAVVEWSQRLGVAAAEKQASGTPEERELAQLQLLASAAIDLHVASDLAASGSDQPAPSGAERGGARGDELASLWSILSADPKQGVAALAARAERAALPQKPDAARRQLQEAVDHATTDICEDAAAIAQATMKNLMELPLPELESAANIVVSEIMNRLGENVSKIVSHAVTLVVQAVDKVFAALGSEIKDEARKQAVGWIKELREGVVVRNWLQQLYEVERVRQEINNKIAAMPQDDAARFNRATEAVTALAARFHTIRETLAYVLRGLSWARSWIMSFVPVGPLALTSGYVANIGCMVYLGGNYVEWYRTGRWFTVATGLRATVSRALGEP